ncbi:hypothetical protein EsHS_00005113 [Epichloe bromicola]
MSTPRNRFHDGCWTCKAKRFQCDRTRPHCLTCTQKGFTCEGYEMRLKWGAGIASRGRFAGASQPVETAIPPRPKGRHRDLVRDERRREAAKASTRSDVSARVDVVDAANQVTSSESENISSPPQLGCGNPSQGPQHDPERGKTAKLPSPSPSPSPSSPPPSPSPSPSSSAGKIPPWISKQGQEEVRLFEESLITFRTELGKSVSQLRDGTFAAGLMLSTIGLSLGCAWTMHLHGIYSVVLTRGLQEPLKSHTPIRQHLIEVLGYLDLPGFAVGRQNPSIGVWRMHCREPGYICRPPRLDSVEFVSGLPRSLLDLLSAIDAMEISEEDLWDWPGAPGSLTQCHLWEAYRLAGILSLRNPRLYTRIQGNQPSSPSIDGSSQASSGSRRATPASTVVIVTRVIGHIDAITRAYLAPDAHKDSLLFNAIDYPLIVAGIEADVMSDKPELKEAIKSCFAVREEAFKFPSRGAQLLSLMEEWWTCYARDEITIDDLATSRGLELGLL